MQKNVMFIEWSSNFSENKIKKILFESFIEIKI